MHKFPCWSFRFFCTFQSETQRLQRLYVCMWALLFLTQVVMIPALVLFILFPLSFLPLSLPLAPHSHLCFAILHLSTRCPWTFLPGSHTHLLTCYHSPVVFICCPLLLAQVQHIHLCCFGAHLQSNDSVFCSCLDLWFRPSFCLFVTCLPSLWTCLLHLTASLLLTYKPVF